MVYAAFLLKIHPRACVNPVSLFHNLLLDFHIFINFRIEQVMAFELACAMGKMTFSKLIRLFIFLFGKKYHFCTCL